jgi:hypothetical protein
LREETAESSDAVGIVGGLWRLIDGVDQRWRAIADRTSSVIGGEAMATRQGHAVAGVGLVGEALREA